MPTKDTHSRIDEREKGTVAGVLRGSPSGLTAQDAGARRRPRGSVPVEELLPVARERLSDELIDEIELRASVIDSSG